MSRSLLAVVCLLLVSALAACGVQQSLSDRPSWSLNGPAPQPDVRQDTPKTYGDWNGPGAPKPLAYGDGR